MGGGDAPALRRAHPDLGLPVGVSGSEVPPEGDHRKALHHARGAAVAAFYRSAGGCC